MGPTASAGAWLSAGKHSAGSLRAATPCCLRTGAGGGRAHPSPPAQRGNGRVPRRDPQLGCGWRAVAEARSGRRGERAAATARLDPSQRLQALSEGSRSDPQWIWVWGGGRMPSRWAGTADGTSLEESAWKSIPQALPRRTRGAGSPDASIPCPELTPGPCRPGKPTGRPVRPQSAGGCSPWVPARAPSPGGERGGCVAAHGSSWVIFMLSEK